VARRLTIVTHRFTPADGGMGTWTQQVARFAARAGWETQVEYFTRTPPAAGDEPYVLNTHPGLSERLEQSGGLGEYLSLAGSVWQLRERLKQSDLSLAVFGEPTALKFFLFTLGAGPVRPYGLIIGCRTFEDHTAGGLSNRIRNGLFRRWMQGAEGIIADGTDIREELSRHGVDPGKVRVMYASIDTGRYHPQVSAEPFKKLLEDKGMVISDEKPLLLYCGRLLFMNRPGDFIEILRRLPEARGVLIGDGRDRRTLEQQAEDLKDRVLFTGYLDESILASAFRCATACLFPLGEKIAGISLVVPKAMACGAAVVTNDVAGMSHLVHHQDNGLLCQEGDIGQWVRSVRLLLEDKSLREKLGQKAAADIRDGWSEQVRQKEYAAWLESLRGRD
jgi:glycosyltransferase involved in cell wall biosynthesis